MNVGAMRATWHYYQSAGKGVALLPLTPLRTVRERLHSYGSSLIKAPFDRSRWHKKSYATFTILTCSLLTHCRRMHTLWLKRSFAFPPLRKILQIFLVTRDPEEVCTVTSWDNVALWRNPYPLHYRTAFAFSTILCPPSLGFPYGRLAIAGRGTGLPCSK